MLIDTQNVETETIIIKDSVSALSRQNVREFSDLSPDILTTKQLFDVANCAICFFKLCEDSIKFRHKLKFIPNHLKIPLLNKNFR